MKDGMKRSPTLPKIDEDRACLSSQDEKEKTTDYNHNIDEKFDDEKDEIVDCESDLALLKAKTSQLKLKTRRPSYIAWKQQCVATISSKKIPVRYTETQDYDISDGAASRIDSSLQWIRNELGSMRMQDQSLARTFLKLRSDIHELKLQWSCEDHKDLIDDTLEDLQEVKILKMICDNPMAPSRSEHLRKFGVTKMNISSRRFSTC